MCRNIHTLFNFEPPATEHEVQDAALQYVRKLLGVFVWLRQYSPLGEGNFSAAGPPGGHLVEPVPGSGGIEVFYVRERRSGLYHVKVSLLNSGRFGVDVLGPAKPRADEAPVF